MSRPDSHITDWFKHGLIGGGVAGIAFAMFEMVMVALLTGRGRLLHAAAHDRRHGPRQQALDPSNLLLTAGAVGLGVHMMPATDESQALRWALSKRFLRVGAGESLS